MMLIVQSGDSCPERLDPSRGPVLAAIDANIDRVGALEAAFDIVLDFGSSLA